MTVSRRAALTVIAAASLAAGILAHLSAGHTSATFDEIILVSGGLRGITEGRWNMVTDQPPLMMYAYGIAAAAADPVRPTEDREWLFDDRWDYARALHFGLGNDATELLAGPRLVGTLLAVILRHRIRGTSELLPPRPRAYAGGRSLASVHGDFGDQPPGAVPAGTRSFRQLPGPRAVPGDRTLPLRL